VEMQDTGFLGWTGRGNEDDVLPCMVTWDMEKAEVLNDFFLSQSSPASAPTTPPKSQKGKAGAGTMKNLPL